MQFRTGIGQDSHRFLEVNSKKKCVIGGLLFEEVPGFDADSDGDVVFHALCNAITSLTHVPILGRIAPLLCHQQGITDSRIFLKKALESLGSISIHFVALALEGARPRFQERLEEMRRSVGMALGLPEKEVGITCNSGNRLTLCGEGKGVTCIALLSTYDSYSPSPAL